MSRAAVAQDSQLVGRLQSCLLFCLGQFRRKACVDRIRAGSELSFRSLDVREGHRHGQSGTGFEWCGGLPHSAAPTALFGTEERTSAAHVVHVCSTVLHGISMLFVQRLAPTEKGLHRSPCYGTFMAFQLPCALYSGVAFSQSLNRHSKMPSPNEHM